MADKAISELVKASQITATDLFVLQQDGTAKCLSGQVLLNWLTAAADGHGGIQRYELLKTEGLVKTYRFTLADQTYMDIEVVDGRGVKSVKPTSTDGLVVTYTITYNDDTIDIFTVTNGAKGDKGDNANVWVKYASQQPTASSHSFGDVPDAWIGITSGHLDQAPTDWKQYQWFQWKGEKGDPGVPATLMSSQVDYQVSDSGTVIPSGSWNAIVPVVAQGKYLWTRTTSTFNTGDPVVSYSVSRMGLDGAGSVSSVANISPDANGNVPLTAENIGALSKTGGTMAGPINMSGQQITGLSAPTANDQAANMGFVNQQMRKAAPRNLLDNSDFTNPVNQRGATSLVGNNDTYQYFIDRWCFIDWSGNDAGTLTLTDDGISVTKEVVYFYQRYEKGHLKENIAYTLAIYYADGTLEVRQKAYPALVVSVANENYDQLYFAIDAGKTVSKVALYEGEYTADTLPEYQPKGYAAELLECQRYALRVSGNIVGHAHAYSAANAYGYIPTPIKLRTNPRIDLLSPLNISTGAYSSDFASVSISETAAKWNAVEFVIETTGLTAGENYVLSTWGVLLSADL